MIIHTFAPSDFQIDTFCCVRYRIKLDQSDACNLNTPNRYLFFKAITSIWPSWRLQFQNSKWIFVKDNYITLTIAISKFQIDNCSSGKLYQIDYVDVCNRNWTWILVYLRHLYEIDHDISCNIETPNWYVFWKKIIKLIIPTFTTSKFKMNIFFLRNQYHILFYDICNFKPTNRILFLKTLYHVDVYNLKTPNRYR